jgi:anion-transporting  ArsA/GET3 family ATPase
VSSLERLAAQRLVVFVGPGGVGKTTLAAAFGIDAAARGKRVVVLTIDPAKRLASALGLDGLTDETRAVDLSEVDGLGTLDAAMLDTRASYDALVARIAPSEDARLRILDNRVYRAFSRTLARSHAYVAMERLYDVMSNDAWDLVVLDTPPLRSALDILDAPGRLVRFLDDRVVRFFLGAVPDAADIASGAAGGSGSRAALRVLGAVASRELVEEMVTFFRLFAAMGEGFATRAAEVSDAMKHESTSFVLVASADPMHLDDARFMRDGLVSRGVAPDPVVLNRSHATEPGDPSRPVARATESAVEREGRVHDAGKNEDVQAVLSVLGSLRDALSRRHGQAMERVDELAVGLPESTARWVLPELDGEPTSIATLRSLLRIPEPDS